MATWKVWRNLKITEIFEIFAIRDYAAVRSDLENRTTVGVPHLALVNVMSRLTKITKISKILVIRDYAGVGSDLENRTTAGVLRPALGDAMSRSAKITKIFEIFVIRDGAGGAVRFWKIGLLLAYRAVRWLIR